MSEISDNTKKVICNLYDCALDKLEKVGELYSEDEIKTRNGLFFEEKKLGTVGSSDIENLSAHIYLSEQIAKVCAYKTESRISNIKDYIKDPDFCIPTTILQTTLSEGPSLEDSVFVAKNILLCLMDKDPERKETIKKVSKITKLNTLNGEILLNIETASINLKRYYEELKSLKEKYSRSSMDISEDLIISMARSIIFDMYKTSDHRSMSYLNEESFKKNFASIILDKKIYKWLFYEYTLYDNRSESTLYDSFNNSRVRK